MQLSTFPKYIIPSNDKKMTMRNIKIVQSYGFLYILAAGIYYLFDFVYMPWLSYRFGNMIFVPLYPSILFANFVGVYAYNYFNEDVLFIELGKNWINNGNGRFHKIKRIIKERNYLTFITLSLWPSPIASYLFFRENTEESPYRIFSVIAIGSIFCTLFWGGGLSLIRLLLTTLINLIRN